MSASLSNPPTLELSPRFEIHAAWMRRAAENRLDDAHAVEDVVQETFLSALAAAELPPEERMRPWLFGILVRRCADHLRHRYGEARRLRVRAETDDATPSPDAVNGLLHAERAEVVSEALAALTDEDRSVLDLRYSDGLEYAEIASRLGLSERAVEYRLVRARGHLRGLLKQRVREGDL